MTIDIQRDLEQFIKEFKDKNDLKYDEANTKSFIIEKILTYLKWDVHSPEDIAREQGRKKKIDYELKAVNIDIGIEAKSIKQNLNEDDGKQLLGYCGDSHILAILTNGKDWWFYLPQAEGGPSRKRFFMMDMFQDPSIAASKFIEFLSKDNIINGNAIENAKSMYRNQKYELKKPITAKDKLEIPKSEKESYLSVDSDFSNKFIESFYFNGNIYKIHKWKDLLLDILGVIHSFYRNDFDKVLGITGNNGRIYFSRNQDEVNLPVEIKDTGIYVDTKLSANNIVALCSDIIYEFGYSNNDLKIKLSSEKFVDSSSLKNKEKDIEEYTSAIAPHINWIKEKIRSNKDGITRIKISYIASKMGQEFLNKDHNQLYSNLNSILFNKNIAVVLVTEAGGEEMLELRLIGEENKIAKPIENDSILSKDKEEEKIKKVGKYAVAAQKILPDLKKIMESEKEIKFKIVDIIKDLGEDFVGRSPTSIWWGLKPVLFNEGIIVDMNSISGEKILTMRKATSDDKLPPSLAKFLKSDNIYDSQKYIAAIQNVLPEIKDTISKEEKFEIYIKDIIKKLGKDFENKSPGITYWGIKYLLFKEKIAVYISSDMNKLYMYKALPGYRLPFRFGEDFRPFENDLELDLSYYPPKIDCANKKLISFNFNGSSYEINTWIGSLEKLIEIIYEKHKDEFYKILNLQSNEGKYMISNYFSIDAKELHKPRKVGDIDNSEIYIETKLPANKIVDACYYLIHEFGYDNKDLRLDMK